MEGIKQVRRKCVWGKREKEEEDGARQAIRLVHSTKDDGELRAIYESIV